MDAPQLRPYQLALARTLISLVMESPRSVADQLSYTRKEEHREVKLANDVTLSWDFSLIDPQNVAVSTIFDDVGWISWYETSAELILSKKTIADQEAAKAESKI